MRGGCSSKSSQWSGGLLNFVVSNPTWANGELKATLGEPFGFIAEMAQFNTQTRPPAT
jgi:hypothetical protein